MNLQKFKFYHHSTKYYQQLYNSINELENKGLKASYTVYPSTINNYRKSKFIKTIKTKKVKKV